MLSKKVVVNYCFEWFVHIKTERIGFRAYFDDDLIGLPVSYFGMFKSDYVYPDSFDYWNFHSLSALYDFAEHKNNTIIIKSYTNFILGQTYLDESTTEVHFKKVYYIG